ncbi:MAG: hypothetical protein WCH34_01335 [Bacteroidota bacterium]
MNKIIKLYYQFWVGAIVNSNQKKKNDPNWKNRVFILYTLVFALNLYSIDSILILFKFKSYVILNIIPGTKLNSTFSFIVKYGLVFIVLNYFLIFYKNRYEKLILKYKPFSGNSVAFYGAISTILAFMLTILVGIFH